MPRTQPRSFIRGLRRLPPTLGIVLLAYGCVREGAAHKQWETTTQIARIAYRLEIVRSISGDYPSSLESLSRADFPWPATHLSPLDTRRDAWNHEFYYRTLGTSDGGTRAPFEKPSSKRQQGYILASCGRDGECSDPWYDFWSSQDPDRDIAIQDGSWLHHPRRFDLCDASIAIRQSEGEAGHFEINAAVDKEPPFGVAIYLSFSNLDGSKLSLVESSDDMVQEAPGRYSLKLPESDWKDELQLTRRFALQGNRTGPTQIVVLTLCYRVPEKDFRDNVGTLILSGQASGVTTSF